MTDLECCSASAEARVLHGLHHLADSSQLLQPLAHEPMETTCKRHQHSQLLYVTSAQTSQCRQKSQLFFYFLAGGRPNLEREFCVEGMEMEEKGDGAELWLAAPATGSTKAENFHGTI